MKSFAKFSALLIIVAFFSSACGKYEDGPKFSLATKKARIINTWVYDEITVDNVFQPLDIEDIVTTIEFKRNNKIIYSIENKSTTGEWELSHDKEYIIIRFTQLGNTDIHALKILRLKSNELWTEEIDGSSRIIRKCKSK
ncbi:MAG: hypothetical protein GX259_05435 [Bacteroidales bacterium]|nr:hypothetical protein [Bacteroidales bacterium]